MTQENGYTYTLTRTLEAPVSTVWKAWTTPEQYSEWASAARGSVEMDVRPGGALKAVMVTPGGDFPVTGSYLEVTENQHLVIGIDMPGKTEPDKMAMDLEASGEQTTIVLTQTCDSEQERDQAEQGSTMLLDGLTAYVTKS